MWDLFRSIFGIPEVGTRRGPYNEFPCGTDNDDKRFTSRSVQEAFQIFSDPLEINRYFEKQMDELMRGLFNFGGFDTPFSGPEHNGFFSGPQGNEDKGRLRDSFLKPEVAEMEKREDKNLDGCISNSEVERFIANSSGWGNEGKELEIRAPQQPYFSFQSVTVRTIRRPDGSVESVRTVRDNTGHEETTVTQQAPPQSNIPALGGALSSDEDIFKLFRF